MKALTVGGATIDTIAIIESDRIERMNMRNADSSYLLLEEGRKTEAEEISMHCGGGGANSAVALARLGHAAAAVIKLGIDDRAAMILSKLEQENVSTRWVREDPRAPTGASLLVSSHERNAAIFTFRGANTLLEERDLDDEAFDVDLVHIANLSNQSANCFPHIVAKAKAKGALVSANPGVRQLTGHGGEFLGCLDALDILILNRHEADTLVGSLGRREVEKNHGVPSHHWGSRPPRLALRGLHGGGIEMGLRAFFHLIRTRGPKHVVVTDGRDGAFVAGDDGIIHVETVRTAVASTAGAGDAFAATYAASVASGSPPHEAVRAASLNAASVLTHVDTQTGLLRAPELAALMSGARESPAITNWPL